MIFEDRRRRVTWFVASLLALVAGTIVAVWGQGSSAQKIIGRRTDGSIVLFDGRTIPPLPRLLGVREQYELRLKWLEQKHASLLPMMRTLGIGMWVIINEEFHNDPVTEYVAPDLVYVSRRDAKVFVDGGAEGLKRFSNYWRPTADYARFFEPLPVAQSERGEQDIELGLKRVFEKYNPSKIALNMGGDRGQDSSLTHDAYKMIERALGPSGTQRFVSANELIEEYFDTRLPEELEHYRSLVLATDVLAQRALSNDVITPGKTTSADLKWWFNQQIASLGVGAEPWFEIHTAVQRYDPEKRQMIPYVHPAPDDLVYGPGDVIHLDCGFNYLGFASDWQKVAYVLRPGETDVPPGLKQALLNGNQTQNAMLSESRPGMTGSEATRAIAKKLEGVGFLPSLYSHPIGYQGHALGPNINARDMKIGVGPIPLSRDSILRPGSYRSIELSATTAVPEWNGGKLTIPFEDDAYLTEKGYEWFRPPQTKWYLIR